MANVSILPTSFSSFSGNIGKMSAKLKTEAIPPNNCCLISFSDTVVLQCSLFIYYFHFILLPMVFAVVQHFLHFSTIPMPSSTVLHVSATFSTLPLTAEDFSTSCSLRLWFFFCDNELPPVDYRYALNLSATPGLETWLLRDKSWCAKWSRTLRASRIFGRTQTHLRKLRTRSRKFETKVGLRRRWGLLYHL